MNLFIKKYPVEMSGNGIPCLVAGIGSLMQKTLSDRFKSHFKVYSSDLYWDQRFRLDHPDSLTLTQIIDDIVSLGRHLALPPFILLGHSAYGLVVIECAKRYPDLIKGLILIGSPVNSNAEVAARNNAYFENHADPYRKQVDAERHVAYSQETIPDPSTRFLRKYIYRDAPRYWHNPTYDCTHLWQDLILDNVIHHFFNTILPAYDVKTALEDVHCPIFLAAGMSDYDCCPWDWKDIQPSTMTISYFAKSGHYPHFEEADLFDSRIESWVRIL